MLTPIKLQFKNEKFFDEMAESYFQKAMECGTHEESMLWLRYALKGAYLAGRHQEIIDKALESEGNTNTPETP